MRSLLGLVILGAIACGCTPAPQPAPPPSPPDASDASPPPAPTPKTACDSACQSLASIGCPEAIPSNCGAVLTRIEADGIVRSNAGSPFSCASVAAVKTVAQAQALGVVCKKP